VAEGNEQEKIRFFKIANNNLVILLFFVLVLIFTVKCNPLLMGSLEHPESLPLYFFDKTVFLMRWLAFGSVSAPAIHLTITVILISLLPSRFII